MEQLLCANIAQNAYDEGVQAYWSKKGGFPVEPNGYVAGTRSYTDWMQGWAEASEYDSDIEVEE